MLITTFKQNADLYLGASNTAHNPFIFNRPPTIEHLQILFDNTLYLTWLYPTFTVPFCTWLLMGFLKTLPKEIEESAMVDGCSRVGAITRVVLPLAVPGLLTVVIFALTLTIQEFVYSLTFISSVGRMTVGVGVPVALIRGDVYYWGSLMAA